LDRQAVLIRHGDDPADDRVVTFFRSRNIEPRIVRPFKGERLGVLDGRVAASVVYGGPFNVYETDKHPFLLDEHRWIEQCIEQQVPLLGICQGAQSIAYTLGAACGPRQGERHEFGYYPVRPTPAGRAWFPDELVVAQAHYHEFKLPDGAQLLAVGDTFPHQAMRYGDNVFAIQFHAEVTRTGFRRWQDSDWAEYGKAGVQTREEQDALAEAHDGKQHTWFMSFLDKLFSKSLYEAPGESGLA
jgi:GMP synthase (glutamine-hydrolysing)